MYSRATLNKLALCVSAIVLLVGDRWKSFVSDLIGFSMMSEVQLGYGIFILKNIAIEFLDYRVPLKDRNQIEKILSKEYEKIMEFVKSILTQPNIPLEVKLKAIKLLSTWSQLDISNPILIPGIKDLIFELYGNTEYLRKISGLVVTLLKKNSMGNLDIESGIIEKCDSFFKSELYQFITQLLNNTVILCTNAKHPTLEEYSNISFSIGNHYPILLYQVLLQYNNRLMK